MRFERIVRCGSREVPYTLRMRRGHRRFTLTVHRDGTVTLTVPPRVSPAVADRYLAEKRTWLLGVLAALPSEACGASADERAAHYHTHREAARALVAERLVALNEGYGFTWGRVAIRRSTSRWGSCSSRGNLNFDYRILFLPPHLRDYLVVHELCHCVELNHSPRFWALVAHTVPAYRVCRRELRQWRGDTLT